jgi:hypothetical protein
MKRHTYETDFVYEGVTVEIELTAQYQIYGSHMAATLTDPEEFPETEITAILYKGKKLKKIKSAKYAEIMEAAEEAVTRDIEDEMEHGGEDF